MSSQEKKIIIFTVLTGLYFKQLLVIHLKSQRLSHLTILMVLILFDEVVTTWAVWIRCFPILFNLFGVVSSLIILRKHLILFNVFFFIQYNVEFTGTSDTLRFLIPIIFLLFRGIQILSSTITNVIFIEYVYRRQVLTISYIFIEIFDLLD